MKFGMTILTLYLFLTGCAFKSDDSKNTQAYSNQIQRKTPARVKLENGKGQWVLIDTIEMPRGDYDLDGTITVKGNVKFPLQYPIFKDTECRGQGYEVSYENRARTATTQIMVVPFVNEKERKGDHLLLNSKDELKLAIYAEYTPIAEYIESEVLPNEFAKSFQPSNQCHYMCDRTSGVKPVRPLKSVFGQYDCFYYAPTTPSSRTRTDDLDFYLPEVGTKAQMDFYLNMLGQCDAVRNNDDLKNYYDQLTAGPCWMGTRKILAREWYFVEMKVPYQAPLYSIENFSQIVRATTTSQTTGLLDQPVTPIRVWSN